MSIIKNGAFGSARVTGYWFDGAFRIPEGGRAAPVHDPASGRVKARVALADEAYIAAAVTSATCGFETWRGLPIARRQAVLFAFRELLNARRGKLGCPQNG